MVQIILSSASLEINRANRTNPSFIGDDQIPPNYSFPTQFYNFIYGNAVYSLPSLSLNANMPQVRRLKLKSFRGNYIQLTNERYYNNHMVVENVTDGTFQDYVFPPRKFASVADYVTALNTEVPDLIFTYNDPNTVPDPSIYGDRVDRVEITANPAGSLLNKSFRLFFDSTSINRSLGFDLGYTQVIPYGYTLIGNYSFTVNSIAKLFISLNIGSKSYTNINSAITYIIYIDSLSNPIIDNTAAKGQNITFNDNLTFDQYIDIQGSQFNQIVVSIRDEYGNVVYLNGHYNLVLEIE